MALDALIHCKPPTWWEKFQESPSKTLAKTLYSKRVRHARQPLSSPITVVCISDTHNLRPDLPPGDLLVHAGDLTRDGTAKELQTQLDWIDRQPHTYKIVIAGNHEIVLGKGRSTELETTRKHGSFQWGSIVYLEESSINLRFPGGRSLTVYGSPWTRKHGNWVFQYEKGADRFTNRVDDDVDILVTHMPPRHHLDLALWGDDFLLKELWRVKPKLHVFGHIHEAYGQEVLVYDRFQDLFEQVCAGRAGMITLLYMAILLLWHWLVGARESEKTTTLINAAVKGGFIDKETLPVQVVQL